MHTRLKEYFYSILIIYLSQNNLASGKSHLLKMLLASDNRVYTNLKQKKHAGGIFCDLAKTFDHANHEILPAQLLFYGIQRTGANWFISNLMENKNMK
jgi:hypothetical protein